MTYQEIKDRLQNCESKLITLRQQDDTTDPSIAKEIKKLEVLKESYNRHLTEATTFVKTKGGDTHAIDNVDSKTAQNLKKDPNITSISTSGGKDLKEEAFDINETKAIAKKVGKALIKALKQSGDQIARIKAHNIESNKFDVHVTYKSNKEDNYSFIITEKDTLLLKDDTGTKELVNIGTKPSGEAIIHVDILANALSKHFNSLNITEGSYDNYEPKHFDICPGAEALRDELIKGGKTTQELGEWTFLHDELFKLEKAVIKANKADERHIKVAKQFKSEIINLSRDLGIEANKIGYLSGHVKKIEDIASKTDGKGDNVTLMSKDISEGPHQTTYVKVSKRDYRKAISIIDQNIDSTYVFTDIVDDDGDGNVIIYFNFREREEGDFDENPGEFIYDLSMDLEAHGISVVDRSHDLDEDAEEDAKNDADYEAGWHDDPRKDEATDINDPVLMKSRAMKTKLAKRKADDKMAKAIGDNPYNSRKDSLVAKLKAMRAQIMRDMEQEAEPEGGPIANAYGDKLNKIDAAIAKASGRKKMDYDTAVGLREDDEEETDYIKRRREEDDYYEDPDYYKEGATTHDDGGDLDVGHQDDEPSMLKASAFETAEYAAKLVKKLAQYDKHDGEVDFPNWWQKKLILARDYMSAAFHYLDSEEKQPAIDRLALEEEVNEGVAKIQKAHGLVVAKMKELAKQYKAGDKSVVTQLKDLTAKKKKLEASLEKAVADTGRNQELTELSGDQREAIMDLQNILDQAAALGDEARQIIRQSFPRMLSKADAYGAFEFGSSANRYDTTLESIIEEIEQYYDEEEDDMEEEYKGKHQGSNYKWPMSQATKDRKEADKVSQSQSSSLIGRLGDKTIKEEKSTCCGRCGRKHVKGTKCKTPYLKGKDHCRTR